MIVLDTDHISELQDPHSPRGGRLSQRLAGAGPIPIATTIISYEEQMRGWLAAINKQPAGERQVVAYDSLAEFLAFYQRWSLLRFDQPAAKEFERLRAQRVRIVRWISRSPRLSFSVGRSCSPPTSETSARCQA